MRHANVWEKGMVGTTLGGVLAFTLPYHGNVPAAVASAVAIYSNSSLAYQPVYDKSQNRNAMLVEPLSGVSVQSHTDILLNMWVEKTLLNGVLYANIFSGSSDNADSFLMPWYRTRAAFGIDHVTARELHNTLGSSYQLLLWLWLLAFASLFYLAYRAFLVFAWPDFEVKHLGAVRAKAPSKSTKPAAVKILVAGHAAPCVASDSCASSAA